MGPYLKHFISFVTFGLIFMVQRECSFVNMVPGALFKPLNFFVLYEWTK